MTKKAAKITFHGDLNEFLRADNSGGTLNYSVDREASIKDVIEALGPPHTEVGKIIARGVEVDFSHPLRPERIEVFPVRPPMDVTRPTLLRPNPLPELKFVVDVNVGKLANRLRLLGLDAAYDPGWRDVHIAELAREQERVVLSKDLALLRRNKVEFGRAVRSIHPDEQIIEIIDFFGIEGPFDAFTRCIHDNVPLEPVDKAEIIDRLEPLTKKYFHEFHICPRCGRIYWPGSHHERMLEWMEKVGLRR